MSGGSRRQWYLLALLGVSIFAYFRFGASMTVLPLGAVGALPPIDAEGLVRALKGISTVSPLVVSPPEQDSVPDRNLFQYGERKPPPPPPMTEAERKAAEEALQRQEKQARDAMAAQQVLAAQQQAEAAAQVAAQQQQAPPPEPPKVTPPAPQVKTAPNVTFKFMGVLGPQKKRVGVFLDGEKMLLARKGEVLDGKFRILDIGAEWADVGYVDPDLKGQTKRIYFGL